MDDDKISQSADDSDPKAETGETLALSPADIAFDGELQAFVLMNQTDGEKFLAASFGTVRSAGVDDAAAVRRLGLLIDRSEAHGRSDGIRRAIEWGNAAIAEPFEPVHRVAIHYFLSNAWEALRKLSRVGDALLEWEQPEYEHQIVHLRQAIRLAETVPVHRVRQCQMYTNLGNLMSRFGRIVDAVAYWNQALRLDPEFGMALGNKGIGLQRWARLLWDPGHQAHHVREAHACLTNALAPPRDQQIYPEARKAFAEAIERLQSSSSSRVLKSSSHSHDFPKKISQAERAYRLWALQERLFLNDLNDLGPDPIAAADVLSMPDITTPFDSGPPSAIGFFNQLKQEFVSARYLAYQGIAGDRPHFSDRDVTLVNTLDYPTYGLGAEQLKLAFRAAYSLLDKVAFFLNDYLHLKIAEKKVTFRGLWYDRQDRSRGLRTDVQIPYSGPLNALFWLGKELYETEPGFTEAIEPDAREIAEIRNQLEHKYFKLHMFEAPDRSATDSDARGDSLAYSINRSDFERRTLHLLRLARAALMYLSLAVGVEERRRAARPGQRIIRMPMYLDSWADEWKV